MQRAESAAGAIQLAIDSITQKIAGLELSLSIEQDFAKLRSFLAEQGTFANPTFDPALSRLGPSDFWVQLKDPGGRAIACSAERLFLPEDFGRLLATGELWYAGGFRSVSGSDEVAILPLSQRVGGRVSHSGSTYVHPDWRGASLAMLMTYLTRALSFRNLAADFNTGVVKDSLYRTSVPRETYGYSHVELALDGYFPSLGGDEKIYLCWIGREEFAARVADLPGHRRCPVPLERAAEPALADLDLAPA
ncbi:MAG TPA: hypothetical protein VFY87_31190 [Geminicoccaceae bacterium]|nr:hypothetical protein [Geminicoccaceae bacterium]